MTRTTEAVFSNGVLKPDDDLGLLENQRVRLIVEVPSEGREGREDRAAALAKLKAGIATMQFFPDGPLPARKDWHDRH